MDILNLIVISAKIGLLYSFASIGVYISFEVIRFPDLSVDSCFALGGACAASFIASGCNPFLATILSMLSGALAGVVLSILYSSFQINKILAGIIMFISLYSINLYIMGSSNVSLLNQYKIFSFIQQYSSGSLWLILFETGINIAVIIIILLLFRTDLGLFLKCLGDNHKVVSILGVNKMYLNSIGLAASGGLIAFSGALVAQNNGYSDINMGFGTLVTSLASLVIGKSITKSSSICLNLIAIVLGTIAYQATIATCLQLGLGVTWVKLVTGIFLTIMITLSVFIKRRQVLKIEDFR